MFSVPIWQKQYPMQSRASSHRDEWHKDVTGIVNAATIDSQRLSASVATCGAAAQLDIDESTRYIAVYTLASPPSSFGVDIGAGAAARQLVPTIHIYLSTDSLASESRTFMLLHRMPVPQSAATAQKTPPSSASGAQTTTEDTTALAPDTKSLCVSKLLWAGVSTLVLLHADGQAMAISSGLRPTDSHTCESSSEDSPSFQNGVPQPSSPQRVTLWQEQRVVDVAAIGLTYGSQRLAVILTARHSGTALTVIDVSLPSSHPLRTVLCPSIGPFRGVTVLPCLARDGTRNAALSAPSIVFAGLEASGCFSLYEWCLSESAAWTADADHTPLPICLRQCMLGPHVHPIGLVADCGASTCRNHVQVILVGLEAHAENTQAAPRVRAREPAVSHLSDTLLLRGKNGVPLMIGEDVRQELQASANAREPLNQVYALLHRRDGSAADGAVAVPSRDALEALSALRIVRPRLTAESLDQASLCVVHCSVEATAGDASHTDSDLGAYKVDMVEHALPLTGHRDVFNVLLAPSAAEAGGTEAGLLLYPFSLSAAAASPGARPLHGFALYNAFGLVTCLLKASPAECHTVGSGGDVFPHIWSSALPPNSPLKARGALGGVVDLAVDGEGVLCGTVLRGDVDGTAEVVAKTAPTTEAGTDRSQDCLETAAAEVTMLHHLQLGYFSCLPRPSSLATEARQADRAPVEAALLEDLLRRVVREEMAASVAPLEARLSRMEDTLAAILRRVT